MHLLNSNLLSCFELRTTLIESFEALRNALAVLEVSVCQHDAQLPGWFQTPEKLHVFGEKSHRHKAMLMVNQLEYLDEQGPREILIGPGIFAASLPTLEAIARVNQCKLNFKQVLLNLKKARVPITRPDFVEYFENVLGKRMPHMAKLLRKMGLARLHLKQCYRLIPCLSNRPSKVSWTWAHTKAIKRITVAEAEQMLFKRSQDNGIAWQLSKLQTLHSDEPLAIVRDLAPHLRANIVIKEGTEIKRTMVKGAMPIFYPAADEFLLPELIPPDVKIPRDEDRAIRSDIQLDTEPFLKSIHIHRYVY